MVHVAQIVHYRPADAQAAASRPGPLPSTVLYPGPWLFPGLNEATTSCRAALVTGLAPAGGAVLAVFSNTGLTWHPPTDQGLDPDTWHLVESCPDL